MALFRILSPLPPNLTTVPRDVHKLRVGPSAIESSEWPAAAGRFVKITNERVWGRANSENARQGRRRFDCHLVKSGAANWSDGKVMLLSVR